MGTRKKKIANICLLIAIISVGAFTFCLLAYRFICHPTIKEKINLTVDVCNFWIAQKAAKRGEPSAQCFLGYAYENGVGIEKNEFAAFRKSATHLPLVRKADRRSADFCIRAFFL